MFKAPHTSCSTECRWCFVILGCCHRLTAQTVHMFCNSPGSQSHSSQFCLLSLADTSFVSALLFWSCPMPWRAQSQGAEHLEVPLLPLRSADLPESTKDSCAIGVHSFTYSSSVPICSQHVSYITIAKVFSNLVWHSLRSHEAMSLCKGTLP